MNSITRKRLRIFVATAITLFTLTRIMPSAEYIIAPLKKPDLTGKYLKASTIEVFSKIYRVNWWGKPSSDTPFFSGTGSHDVDAVEPYVAAVRSFIVGTFSKPPDAADLGCGDYNIGRYIRNITERYIACDIVPELIDYNRIAYADDNVDFRVLDMISEELPAAEIGFIRQVLQHLDNERIAYIVPKLYQYRWVVITEHLPFQDDFIPNLDIKTGTLRLRVNSGVELTKPPFQLQYYEATVLCEILVTDGKVRTTAYRLLNS